MMRVDNYSLLGEERTDDRLRENWVNWDKRRANIDPYIDAISRDETGDGEDKGDSRSTAWIRERRRDGDNR